MDLAEALRKLGSSALISELVFSKEVPLTASVSIIIAGRDREATLCECLSSVERSSHRPVETYYVDTGSNSDLPKKIARQFPKVTVIELSGGNPQTGRNLAASQSKGDWLLFCDDDTSFANDAIQLMVEYGEEHPDVAMVGGQTVNVRTQTPEHSFCLISPIWLPREGRVAQSKRPMLVLSVRNAYLIRRSAFRLVGGWDPKFFIQGDEVDLALRLHAAGFYVAFIPTAQIFNNNPDRGDRDRTISEIGVTRYTLGERNGLLLQLKNLEFPTLLAIFPLVCLWTATVHSRRLSAGSQSFVLDSMVGLKEELRRDRAQIATYRKRSDIEILLHLLRPRY